MSLLRSLAKKLPGIRALIAQRDRHFEDAQHWKRGQSFPPGHYYSPIPNHDQLRFDGGSGSAIGVEPTGIDFCWDDQARLLESLSAYCSDLPFGDTETVDTGCRYFYENGFFSYTDGIALYGMLRHFRPHRMIEVGSGFSSVLAIDTNERFLDNRVEFTFIEPYADRLHNRLRGSDRDDITILESPVQEVPLETFQVLGQNDILLIDSSHVSKCRSDVNYLVFDVIPRLKPGVLVHFHDIFYPFEYPRKWILDGRSWNEAYMVRSLLMFNDRLRIRLWCNGLAAVRPKLLRDLVPLAMKNVGASLWLQTVDRESTHG